MLARPLLYLALLLLLLFTQLGSYVHSLSHQHGHPEQGKLLDDKCNLCDKYAQSETALATASPLLPLPPSRKNCLGVCATCGSSRHFAVFSARAPPV